MFCGRLDACHTGTVRGEFRSTCEGTFDSNEPLDAGTTGEESVVPTPAPAPAPTPTPTPTVGPTPSGTNPTPTPEVVPCDAVLPDDSDTVSMGSFKFSGDGCRFTYYESADCSGTEYCHDLQPDTCIAYAVANPFRCENRQFYVYGNMDFDCSGDLAFNDPQQFGDVDASEEDNAEAFQLIGQCYDKNGAAVYTAASSAFSVAAGALVGALYFL